MAFERELAGLILERKRSVTQIAKAWGEGPHFPPETPKLEDDGLSLSGAQLIAQLLFNAKDLEGRVVGRNKDDASFIASGLEILEREWTLLDRKLRHSEQDLAQARTVEVPTDSARSRAMSSPESGDSNYVHKQQRRIQQLEDQEMRLQLELKQLKAKWEAIMAKTMEQQAAIHRQQMQEQEALIADRDAEIEKLRLGVRQGVEATPVARHIDSLAQPQQHRQDHYRMAGRMIIGQTLQIVGPYGESAPDSLQWYQILGPGHWQPISGATKSQYSPEPCDVGHALGCCITPPQSTGRSNVVRISSRQPVAAYPGFEKAVQALFSEAGAEFSVVIVQRNGMLHTNREVCTLEVTASHIALRLPNAVLLQQPYTAKMQVCGARGAGDAAAQGVFLAFKPQEVYMLACETARERNACISLIRRMAALRGFSLRGPEEMKAAP